jgi:hypothetical protein
MRPYSVVFALLTLASAPATAQSAPPVPAAQQLPDSAARRGVGQLVVITGRVVQVKSHTHMGSAYLNFGGRFPDHTFSVIIPDSALARFGDLTRFEGHIARARGTVFLQNDKWPAMTLTEPADLELVP